MLNQAIHKNFFYPPVLPNAVIKLESEKSCRGTIFWNILQLFEKDCLLTSLVFQFEGLFYVVLEMVIQLHSIVSKLFSH